MSFSMQDFLTPQITAVSYRGEEVHDTHPATSTMLTAPCAMTYGRTMHKALKKFDIEPEMWPALAADRGLWRETLKLGRPAVRRSLRQARR